MIVKQPTGSLCTDQINIQFIRDASDILQTPAAERLVTESAKVDGDFGLDLEERIAGLDRLVDQTQTLLTRAGFDYTWADDYYSISRV